VVEAVLLVVMVDLVTVDQVEEEMELLAVLVVTDQMVVEAVEEEVPQTLMVEEVTVDQVSLSLLIQQHRKIKNGSLRKTWF
jgi:glycerol dehydrogenase-like iron-containing ADH family enzyme